MDNTHTLINFASYDKFQIFHEISYAILHSQQLDTVTIHIT